jgi:hypothetical protein
MIRLEGFQPRSCRALLRALLLMDLRGQQYAAATGAGPHEAVAPRYWVMGQYLTVSMLLTLLLFARVDATFFAFASLSCAALLTLSAIVSEFNEVLFDPLDLEVVAHRPVSPVTYAAARIANLSVYLLLIGLAVTIFPTVVGVAQRDAGWTFVPAYVFASVVVCVLTASAAVAAYAWQGTREGLQKLQTGFAWVQIALILVLFYGGQGMLRNGSASIPHLAAFPPEWLRWVPTHGLAVWVTSARDGFGASHAAVALGLLGAMGLAGVVALWRLSSLYHHASRDFVRRVITIRHRSPRGTLHAGLLRLMVRSRGAAAGAWLTRALLFRDAELQMRTWTPLGVPAGAALLAIITGAVGDPMREQTVASLAPLAVVALLASALPAVLFNLRFTRDFEAAWILQSAPMADPSRLTGGARRQALSIVFLPFMLLYFGLVGWSWHSPSHAAAEIAGAWLVIEVLACVAEPWSLGGGIFAAAPVVGASLGPMAAVGAVLGAVAMACLTLQQWASRRPAVFLAYMIGLVITRVLLTSTAGRSWRAPQRAKASA